jgi:hypothetical protein
MEDAGELSCREEVELVTDYLEEALTPNNPWERLFICDGCTAYLDQRVEIGRSASRWDPIVIESKSVPRALGALQRSPLALQVFAAAVTLFFGRALRPERRRS